ncbi:MAG: NAD-dependent epimerase/dehydratase family protein [Candidatus Pacearchaeota archaeon]|nr:NAD-dependent epimerase/dehydratase family protein [Candidatus Pacearchaeota archaeon]
MRVLVTGGCGFLGTNICLYYKNKDADVIAYDNLTKHEFSRNPYMRPSARNHTYETLKKSGVDVLIGDVRDKNYLLEAAKNCDYICHTAAQPAMTISWEDPELDFSTNTLGTFNVLDVARKLDIPVAICSTVHTYGPDLINSQLKEEETRYTRIPASINEELPLLQGMVTPLHASKRCNEIYAQSYIDTYSLPVSCFRLTGIYGPHQFGGEDHGWVANFAIRSIIGEPITIFGTGKQVRDILYASDVAAAFDAFYNNKKPGIYTLGGGEPNMISLNECITLIKKITAQNPEIIFDKDRPGDLRYFVGDHSKFTKATGWTPKIRPSEGVARLISWVKENESLFIKRAPKV